MLLIVEGPFLCRFEVLKCSIWKSILYLKLRRKDPFVKGMFVKSFENCFWCFDSKMFLM